MKLSKADKDLLTLVKDGADIYRYDYAKRLRELEKKGLVAICKPMAYTGDGTDQVPYFGCIVKKGVL